MATGVDDGGGERGCKVDIFPFLLPFSSFFLLLLKNGHWCRWWLWGRGMQRWWSSRPQRKQNPRQASEPTRTHHVCCTSCTYVPRLSASKLCAHQNPSCLLSFPRVFSCVWSLFSLMPWFGFHNFSRAHQNPSIIMSLLSFLLSHILLRLVILTLKKGQSHSH